MHDGFPVGPAVNLRLNLIGISFACGLPFCDVLGKLLGQIEVLWPHQSRPNAETLHLGRKPLRVMEIERRGHAEPRLGGDLKVSSTSPSGSLSACFKKLVILL